MGTGTATRPHVRSFERFLRGWLESFDEFRVEPQRIVEQDDRLIAVVRQTGKGRASGLEIEATLAHGWTVADGRAIRWEAVGEPEEALGDRAQLTSPGRFRTW
jgi:ketosteroid isomerase-like protein